MTKTIYAPGKEISDGESLIISDILEAKNDLIKNIIQKKKFENIEEYTELGSPFIYYKVCSAYDNESKNKINEC